MLQWALAFLVLALIAGLFGFVVLAAELAWVGKVLFIVFLVLFIIGLVRRGGSAPLV